MKKALLFTTALVSLILLIAGSAYAVDAADTTGSGQALEISPPVITLSVDPGKTINTQINIRDISSAKLIVKGQVNDFVAAGEDGTPKLIMDEDSTEVNPYSMKSWIAPIDYLTLNPKEIKKLPITINVPANAAPGGYYATVRFTATAPELKDSGVALSASLGSLLLIKVNGDIKEQMSVTEVGASLETNGKNNVLFESAPIYLFQRIKNSGNIHEQPSGQVTITDMFGKKIAVANINLPPKNILPNSIRRFEQKLDKSIIGDKMLFGKYDAAVRMSYGSDGQIIKSSFSFWVIPYRLIGMIILLAVSGFFALRFGLKRYNAHIIKKAHRSRRR